MTPTYQALELAARDLIDAVSECDLGGESGPESLMSAVADTCAALGDGMAAHKARHRLASAVAFAWEDPAGVEHRDGTIERLALDLRATVIPWSDGREGIDSLADVAVLLDDLADEIGAVEPATAYPEIDGARPDGPHARDLAQAVKVARTAAEITRAADDAVGVSDLETLADALADREDIADPAETLACVASALDAAGLDGSAVADATAAAKRGAVLDDLAAGIIEAHEAGASVSSMLDAVASALRAAGRDDAARVLVGPE